MSNLGQYITNSQLSALRSENAFANARLQTELEDLPSKIIREQVSLEKYGVSWTKLNKEYMMRLDAIFHLQKNISSFERTLVPNYNNDGSKKKLTIKMDTLFGAIAVSVLCSTPALLLLFVGYELWMRIVGFVLPIFITYMIVHLSSPKHPVEYRRCSQDEIKNYFVSLENHKRRVEQMWEEIIPFREKLDEIDNICG